MPVAGEMCGKCELAARAPLGERHVASMGISNDDREVWVEGRAVGSLLEAAGIDRCWPLSLQPQYVVVQVYPRYATKKSLGRWRLIERDVADDAALFVCSLGELVGGGLTMAVCPTYRSNSALAPTSAADFLLGFLRHLPVTNHTY